jgi:hypothetical protein
LSEAHSTGERGCKSLLPYFLKHDKKNSNGEGNMGTPSMELRFIERDGKKVLQQLWYLPVAINPMLYVENFKWPTEWRDVPLVSLI